MKKNVMMRLACFLLVAVLISTSAISGTYAKYTTQDAGDDEARVAKWGVELQVVGNLYGDSYGADDKIVLDTDSSVTVQTLDTSKDVVAPGTKNAEGFEISLKGQPEVDGTITTDITTQNIFLAAGSYGVMVAVNGTTITEANFEEIKEVAAKELYKNEGTAEAPVYVLADKYEAGKEYYTLEDAVTIGNAYYPVVYKMAGSSSYYADHSVDTLAEIGKAIATKLGLDPLAYGAPNADHITTTNDIITTFQSNDNLADFALDNLIITWEWKYDWDGCGEAGDKADVLCKADTILGNLMAAAKGEVINVVKLKDATTTYEPVADEFYCLDTQFAIDITVTQVD